MQVSKDQRAEDTVGRPIQHVSSNMQVTGEAIYVDDMPPYSGLNYAELALSYSFACTCYKVLYTSESPLILTVEITKWIKRLPLELQTVV